MNKITLLITDDHKLVRESLSFILNSNPLFQVIAECSSGEEAVEQAKELKPNVVIMDINMSGITGIAATKLIRKYSPGTKILGVSMHSHPSYARKMIREGASGYVTKNSGYEEIITAIQEINAGRKYICKEVKDILSNELMDTVESKIDINSLSGREIEVIEEVKKGHSSKEIASILNICVRTVEVHRHNILKKLNLKNAASLVNFINCQPEFSYNFPIGNNYNNPNSIN